MLRHYPHRPNHCLDLCTMYMQLRLHHHQCLWNQDQAFYSWFLKACQSPKHQHLFTSPGLKVYQKQHKLILHQVLSGHMLLNYGSSSLPKLQLKKFDGDPLQWPDWSSMFKSIVRDADLSLNGKIQQHLQNSVAGRAKSTVEGYGYSRDSYYEALKELEARFGKPSLVVSYTWQIEKDIANEEWQTAWSEKLIRYCVN